MERLTKRLPDGKTVMDCDSCKQKKDKQCTFYECRASLIKQLAAYEDIAELCGGFDRLRELAEVDRLVREMEWRSDKYINYTAAREKACKGCTSRDGTDGCYSMEPCERLIAEIICAPAANVVPAERAMEGMKGENKE